MAAEDAASNDASLAGFAYVGDATGQDGIAIVSAAVAGQETDEALGQDVRQVGEPSLTEGANPPKTWSL